MLVIPVVAFGDWHVRHAQVLLASLRSEGNLPDVDALVQIYTDQPAAFRGYRVDVLKPSALEPKHAITSRCYADALCKGHAIVPLSADMVCPTGLLRALERLAKDHRVVVAPVVRTNSATMLPALPLKDGVIALSPRELCRLAFEHLHPLQAKMYWDRLPADIAPTTIFRRQGSTIAARCFHMHPLLLKVPADTRLSPGIDGELMARIAPADCHVITDSDETVVFDLTDPGYNWSAGYGTRFKPDTPIESWALNKANKTHRWFFSEHECYVHAGDIEYPPPDARLEALREKIRALP